MDLMRLCLTAFHGGLLAFVVGFTAVPAAAQGTFCARLTDPVLTAPGPERIEGTEPFVYRATPTGVLRLHVLRPAAETSTGAAVIGISMGGWMSGNVANFMPNARLLAARGVTVIMPDIRSWCRDGANIVDQVVDSKAAVRWVRSHAVELGIDPARIAVAGGSSAGHLALSTAMFAEIDAAEERVTKSRPDLLLLFFPCVDPTSEIEQAVSEPAIGTRGAEVSPLLHLAAGLPPTIILQGTDDPLLDNVREFCRGRANSATPAIITNTPAPNTASCGRGRTTTRRASPRCSHSSNGADSLRRSGHDPRRASQSSSHLIE